MSLKVIGNGTIRMIAYEFLLALHSNYGPILYHFPVKARYWPKIAIFTYPACIRHHCQGEYYRKVRYEKIQQNGGLPDGEKKSEDMFARFDTIHERDRYQTDRRTDRQMNTARRHSQATLCSLAAVARQKIANEGSLRERGFYRISFSISYTAVNRPVLEYAALAWHHLVNQAQQPESIYKRAIRIILMLPVTCPTVMFCLSLNSNHQRLDVISFQDLFSRTFASRPSVFIISSHLRN